MAQAFQVGLLSLSITGGVNLHSADICQTDISLKSPSGEGMLTGLEPRLETQAAA